LRADGYGVDRTMKAQVSSQLEGANPSTAVAAPLFEAIEVSKTYTVRGGDTIVALQNVNFRVAESELVAIVGASGCGKSTLLKILAGTLQRTSGSVLLRGRTVEGPSKNVGFVFQSSVLLPWRTVLSNILLPIELQQGKGPDDERRAKQYLELVGLRGFETKYPNELSGGMQQRVSIGRALIHDPALLLMDEPFAALDAMTREFMNLELLRIWQVSRKTVVIVTHSIPEAVFLADRVFVMTRRPGRIHEILKIDLPRPRTLDMMNSAEFGRYIRMIRRHFEAQGALD
jgi:NitT/TauT family transport system ATP-binding protein